MPPPLGGLAQVQAQLLAQREIIMKDLGMDDQPQAFPSLPASRKRSLTTSRGPKRQPTSGSRSSPRHLGIDAGGPSGVLPLEGPQAKRPRARKPEEEEVTPLAASGVLNQEALIKATVAKDCTIKAFVEDALKVERYVAGRGFHEFAEGIKISVYTTEHLLEGPDGKVYRGSEAAKVCGLATKVVHGQKDAPTLPEGWRLYLRSKSYGRKLRKGQRFIYEK